MSPKWNKLDAAIQEQMAQRHIPGAALAVASDGEILHAAGYGFANLEWEVTTTPTSVFEIASITKTFVATAVVMLAREGKIGLDVPVTTYLPELADPYRSVTIRHLLSHTGGVLRDGLDGYWKSPPAIARDYPAEEMFGMISAAPLVFGAGESYAYSNSAYFLLGRVLETACGQPCADFLSERIFQPLNMGQTRIATRRDVIPQRAAGYAWENGRIRNAPYCGLDHHGANGGIVSTVLDLARWDGGLTRGVLLPDSEWETIWTPIALNSGEPAVSARDALGLGSPSHIGLGWGLGTYRGHRTTGHAGALPGYTSQFTRYRDDRLTIIVLCNNWMGQDGRGHAPTLARVAADHCIPNLAPLTEAEQAAAAYWAGEFPRAAASWSELADRKPRNPEAAYLAARAYARAGNTDEAFRRLQQAVDGGLKDPKRAGEESDLEAMRSDDRWKERGYPTG